MTDASFAGIIQQLRTWFAERKLSHDRLVVRLPDQQTGLAFLGCVEREFGPLWRSTDLSLRPTIAYMEIMGIRFTWPMPELPDVKPEGTSVDVD